MFLQFGIAADQFIAVSKDDRYGFEIRPLQDFFQPGGLVYIDVEVRNIMLLHQGFGLITVGAVELADD
jgi:hypothetical protein